MAPEEQAKRESLERIMETVYELLVEYPDAKLWEAFHTAILKERFFYGEWTVEPPRDILGHSAISGARDRSEPT